MTLKSVHVVVSNRWTVFQCPPERIIDLKKIFQYHPPGYEFFGAYRSGSWDGYKNMLLRGRVATGLFLEFKSAIEKKYALTIEDNRIFPKFRKCSSDSGREYQN